MKASPLPAVDSVVHRLRAFWPAPTAVDAAERVRMVLGAALGIGITALLSHAMPGPPVLVNALLLTATAYAFHKLVSRHRYPPAACRRGPTR